MSLEEKAAQIRQNLLPKGTGSLYLKTFEEFSCFIESNGASETNPPSRDLYLLYFASLSGQYAPSILWSKYSMINTVSKTRYNIDLKTYAPGITCYLKKQDADHLKSTKKASVFTSDEVRSFLLNTPSVGGCLALMEC